MERRRNNFAPFALYALAFSAIAVSLLAWRCRSVGDAVVAQGDSGDGVWLHAAHPLPAKPQAVLWRRNPSYRPALLAIGRRPTDHVRCTPAPLRSALRDKTPDWLTPLIPAEPLWTARDIPLRHTHEQQTLHVATRLGHAWGGAQNHAARTVSVRPVIKYLARQPKPRVVSSPKNVSASVVIGPGDRLAIVVKPAIARRSVMTVRQRERVSTVLPVLDGASEKRVAKRPDEPAEASSSRALALRAQIAKLLGIEEADAWALAALAELDLLIGGDDIALEAYTASARRLTHHAQQAHQLADRVGSNRTAVLLRKAGYAIERRMETWLIARRLEQRQAMIALATPSLGDRSVRQRLERLARRAPLVACSPTPNRASLIDSVLAGIAAEKLKQPLIGRRVAAPVASLGDQAAWSPDPLDISQLVQDLEQYELKPQSELAHRIALRRQDLGRSGAEDLLRLAGRIDHDYRNANLRIAIAHDLLHRQLPQPPASNERVNDTIAGTPVRGAALTNTNLGIRLTPDPHAWRMAIEARGKVESRTVAHGGPARVHSLGTASFTASKPIVVHFGGIATQQANCVANSQTRLVGIRTQYDRLPLVPNIIRSRAQGEYRNKQSQARWETENRIATRVSKTLDQQSANFLEQAQQYHAKVLHRAGGLGLKVEPIELRTTDTRLIARMRLANPAQLAAHTPRNRAPVDSVASLQMHESLVNNALEGLELGEGSLTPGKLREILHQKLSVLPQKSEHQGRTATFLFDPAQPVQVVLDNGQIEVVLAFRELVVERSRFSRFKVHAFFTPSATTQGVWLTQHEPVRIEGRMRTARRAALHTVFGEIMPAGARRLLAATTPEQRERMSGLMVTQLVIDDGWLGLAIGPQAPGRVALRERFVR